MAAPLVAITSATAPTTMGIESGRFVLEVYCAAAVARERRSLWRHSRTLAQAKFVLLRVEDADRRLRALVVFEVQVVTGPSKADLAFEP